MVSARMSVFAALLVLTAGLLADATAACDQKCRITTEFKACTAGVPNPCLKFVVATCLGCGNGGATGPNFWCSELAYYRIGSPSCNNVQSMGNAVFYHPDCTAVCSCTTANTVEGAVSGNSTGSMIVDLYVCGAAP